LGWVTGIVVYVLTWWIVLFMTLPLWVKPTQPEDTGYGTGAPKQPYLWYKVALTSTIAAVIWGVIYILVIEPWISFRGG
jgi:predicted secreted protein